MHEEEGGEEVQSPGTDVGQGMGEASIEQSCQSKVEMAGEGEAYLPVHLTQRPFHTVPSDLHHVTQVLRQREGCVTVNIQWLKVEAMS